MPGKLKSYLCAKNVYLCAKAIFPLNNSKAYGVFFELDKSFKKVSKISDNLALRYLNTLKNAKESLLKVILLNF